MIGLRAVVSAMLLAFIGAAQAGEQGIASIYANGDGHAWSKTANGERVNPQALTAAHKTLPFGTRVKVTANNKSVVVRINDRGPFKRGRVIDLTPAGAARLGFRDGLRSVRVEVLKDVQRWRSQTSL